MSNTYKITNKPIIDYKTRQVDVIFFSGSRYNLLVMNYESFIKHVKFSGKINFYLVEDIFDEEKSKLAHEFAKKHNFAGILSEKIHSYGKIMTRAFNELPLRSQYMFSLEEDHRFIKDLDLDAVYDVMEKYREINLMRIHRRSGESNKEHAEGKFHFALRPVEVNGKQYMTTGGCHWYFMPAIWRREYIMPKWQAVDANVHHFVNSHKVLLKKYKGRPTPDQYADELGVRTWDNFKNQKYLEHTSYLDYSIHEKYGKV